MDRCLMACGRRARFQIDDFALCGHCYVLVSRIIVAIADGGPCRAQHHQPLAHLVVARAVVNRWRRTLDSHGELSEQRV